MRETTPPQEEQNRLQFLKVIGANVPIFGLLSAIGFVVIYGYSRNWQLLAIAGAALIGSVLYLLAVPILNRGHAMTAAMLMLVVGAALFAAFAFFWSGIMLLLIAGAWTIPGMIAIYGVPPGKRLALPIAGALATAVIITLEFASPLERLNVMEPYLLRWLVPLFVILGGILALVMAIRAIRVGRIFNRLLVAFLAIVLIPSLTITAFSSFGSIEIDRQYAFNTLESVTSQKENAINQWIANLQNDLRLTFQDGTTLDQMLLLIRNSGEEERYPEPYYTGVVQRLQVVLTATERFNEIFLMDLDGNIIATTNINALGQNFQYQEFFWQGRNALYVNPPAYLPAADEISIVISRPVINEHSRVVGVLAGRADMRAVDQVIASRVGLGTTGRSYLVDTNYAILHGVVSGSATQFIDTPATRLAIETAQNGFELYTNHLGVPSAGVYHWMPDLKVALITEISQAEAFSGVTQILTTNLLAALLAVLIAIFSAIVIVRTISAPLGELAQATNQVAAGNLSVRAEVKQEDEIGQLARAFNNMTMQLQELVANLEGRVAERTRDLERRAVELQVAAEVARDASLATNLDELLNRSARLIRERFGFYHVGIFLLDKSREYAVLRAAGGEAGQLMLANKHRLKVGEVGMVGFVSKVGEPRIALDTGADEVYFRNPLLPYTHSEMTLPLKIGTNIIGVLDVQSDKFNAFDQEDMSTLQIMADQLAVAIEKTRLMQEVETSASEVEKTYREYTARTWRIYSQQENINLGYRFDGTTAEPILVPPAEGAEAIEKARAIVTRSPKTEGGVLAVPIKLRGQSIGTLNLRFKGRELPPDTIALVEETAERLALALENARLVQETQRLAIRERQINLIAAQTQRSTDLETILQETIRELGNALGVPRTFIQIGLKPSGKAD